MWASTLQKRPKRYQLKSKQISLPHQGMRTNVKIPTWSSITYNLRGTGEHFDFCWQKLRSSLYCSIISFLVAYDYNSWFRNTTLLLTASRDIFFLASGPFKASVQLVQHTRHRSDMGPKINIIILCNSCSIQITNTSSRFNEDSFFLFIWERNHPHNS